MKHRTDSELAVRSSAPDKSMISLRGLAQEVLHACFADKHIRCDFPAQGLIMRADAPRLKLAIRHLLDNACRYSPVGAPPPLLHLSQSAEAVTISVRDHGFGIDAEHLLHLAQPFCPTDGMTGEDGDHRGPGLYLCRLIAEAHGGMLQIDSQMGAGTTVQLSLPCSPAALNA